jgi:ABC-type multidrug transport system fused ATPase/permease subunit
MKAPTSRFLPHAQNVAIRLRDLSWLWLAAAIRRQIVRDADKIIVLKDGVVAEEGTNDELIPRGGVYAEAHRVQYATPPAHAFGAA